MYSSDSKKNNESDYSDEDKSNKKELLIGKRKDKKDKGYATLEGESSPEEEIDTRSPSKSKKTKAFKFSSKKEKREKSRDKENKDTEKEKKKELEKEKEKKKDKDKSKTKNLGKKKLKNSDSSIDISEELPIVGVPLEKAVQRNPCHDGVKIPLLVRNCIDYVEEHGLTAEGVYKLTGVKSRVQHVYNLYNRRKTVYESDFDLTIATSLLKYFLRSLPEVLLTKELLPKFEDPNMTKDVSGIKDLILQLPDCNRDLLTWLIIHFKNITNHEKQNKINASYLGAIFCPLLQINPRLFNTLVTCADELFPNTVLRRYIPPMRCVSPNMPSTFESVSMELAKQESLLGQIHFEMNAGFISKEKEDELWCVQRNITHLKRKLKSLERESGARRRDSSTTENDAAPHESSATSTLSVESERRVGYDSSQEQLNDEDSSEDEEKALEFESEQLINLVKILQEEIKTERLKINELKAELRASKNDTSISEYVTNEQEILLKNEDNMDVARDYNLLQFQKQNLLRSIVEEREAIIDLKVQISMAQTKCKPLKPNSPIGVVQCV